MAICGSVGVEETKAGRRATAHRELAAMSRAMVRTAKRDQVVDFVHAAFCARFDVVHVDKGGVATPRHRAAVQVSAEHRAPHGGRHVLSRAMFALARAGTVACDLLSLARAPRPACTWGGS
jgi:hypothetical protein